MADRERLGLVIVGHVDHGKSTLIGRLLYDSGSLAPEKMEEIRKASEELGHGVEFAYVMDNLEEERAGEMTVDTAQTFFRSATRDYVIIDAPGHKELLRNMVTGASQADAAILVVDAAEGLGEQTTRHASFIAMLGIDQIAVLVNKMDKAGWREERFRQIADAVAKSLESIGLHASRIVPGCAISGDNIAVHSERMPWYVGPTVMAVLDTFPAPPPAADKPLRFPVQDVYLMEDKRLVLGRVESGRIQIGQDIVFLPCGVKARVAGVEVFGEKRTSAEAGECIGLRLEGDHAFDRGEVACLAGGYPAPTQRFLAGVFWIDSAPCTVGEALLLRAATQTMRCVVERIEGRYDSSSLQILEERASHLEETEIGQVVFTTRRPVVLDPFQDIPAMGRIVLARGSEVVGGGLVGRVKMGAPA